MRTSQDEMSKLRASQAYHMALVILILVQIILVNIAKTAEVCVLGAAQVFSVQGTAELRRANNTIWQSLDPGVQLCADDQIRVRRDSSASIRLMNGSMLELDQKASITFSQAHDNETTLLSDLFTDTLHILSRTPKPFKVRTPFANAGVEG